MRLFKIYFFLLGLFLTNLGLGVAGSLAHSGGGGASKESLATYSKLLFKSSRENNLEGIKKALVLASTLYNETIIDSKNKKGRTALSISCLKGFIENVKFLLSEGADYNILDNNNVTALHLCALNGHVECVRKLLDCGAEAFSNIDPFVLTPFDLAAQNGHLFVMRVLLERNKKNLVNINKNSVNTARVNFKSNMPYDNYFKTKAKTVIEGSISISGTSLYRSIQLRLALPITYDSLYKALYNDFHLKKAVNPRFFAFYDTSKQKAKKQFYEILKAEDSRITKEILGFRPILITVSHGEDCFLCYEEENEERENLEIQEYFSQIAKPSKENPSKTRLHIFSWGRDAGHENPGCDLTFDLTSLYAQYNDKSIRKETGSHPEIQAGIKKHPEFSRMLNKIIFEIEKNKASSVSFVCRWGKHRSVAFAEILKKDIYPQSQITHIKSLSKSK